jgi:hypothetical protein
MEASPGPPSPPSPTSWHTGDHKELRRGIISKIIAFLRDRKGAAADEAWLAHLPRSAAVLEASLYSAASSLGEYRDPATLQTRLQTLALESRSPGAKTPSPSLKEEDEPAPAGAGHAAASLADAAPWRALTGQSLWFALVGGVSLLTALLGTQRPDIVIREFGGQPTPSARVWVFAAAAGHCLVAFLCVAGIFSRSLAARQLVGRSLAVFILAYGAAMVTAHVHHEKQPKGPLAHFVAIAVNVGLAAYFDNPARRTVALRHKNE